MRGREPSSMKTLAWAASAALLLTAAAGSAQAAQQDYTFSGSTSQGAYSGTVSLDVQNGYAVSGSGEITGAGLGVEDFSLVSASTPGAIDDGGGLFQFRSNGGDDIIGVDDAVPLTTTGGILFAANPKTPTYGGNLLFGAYANGDGTFSSFFYGTSATGYRFYEQGSPTTFSAAVSAAPEPGLWVLMFGGVGILGAMLRVVQARRRDDEVSAQAA